MKSSLQSWVSNSNQNQIDLMNKRNLKRKRNCSGKENIDPSPATKKEALKPGIIPTAASKDVSTNNASRSNNSMFTALLEVASLEYETCMSLTSQQALSCTSQTSIETDQFNSIAMRLVSIDPFFNDFNESLRFLPEKIQTLFSEFHELDAEQTVKNYQLTKLRQALESIENGKLNPSTYKSYKAQILDRINIILTQSKIIGDKKMQKSEQLKHMIMNPLNQFVNGIENKEKRDVLIKSNEENTIATFKSLIESEKTKPRHFTANNYKSNHLKKNRNKIIHKRNSPRSNTNKQIITQQVSKKQKIDNKQTKEIVLKNLKLTEKTEEQDSESSNDENNQNYEMPSSNTSTDPDELFCLCRKNSFGNMIFCDNKKCTVGWFHFKCVGLKIKPKGKWYCPKCRGDTDKVKGKINS